jgi:hypothetical protein
MLLQTVPNVSAPESGDASARADSRGDAAIPATATQPTAAETRTAEARAPTNAATPIASLDVRSAPPAPPAPPGDGDGLASNPAEKAARAQAIIAAQLAKKRNGAGEMALRTPGRDADTGKALARAPRAPIRPGGRGRRG